MKSTKKGAKGGPDKNQMTGEQLEARRQAVLTLRAVSAEFRKDLGMLIGRFIAKNSPNKETDKGGELTAQVPVKVLRSIIMSCVEEAVVLNVMDPDESTSDAVYNLVNVIPAFGNDELSLTRQQIADGIDSYDKEKPIPTGWFGKK